MLSNYQTDLRLELVRNPHFREERYPDAAGALLPQVDRLTFHILKESQPRWLHFLSGNLDLSDIPKDRYDSAIDASGELSTALKRKGVQLWRDPQLDLTFVGFNMEDPILGKHVKLRQAMSLAVDAEKRIRILFNGRAVAAQGPIPPGLSGYDETWRNPYRRHDLKAAQAKLSEAGFAEGRGLPEFVLHGLQETNQRQGNELFIAEMKALGIRVRQELHTWPEFLQRVSRRQAQLFSMSWVADYPDGENFLALFYSRNLSPGNNHSNYHNATFDRLYDQARVLPDSPQRTALYQEMVRLVCEEAPLIFGEHRIRYTLTHDWVKNYAPHPMRLGHTKYYAVDTARRKALRASW
jgi:ABC-type transport system substrate-binding protein